MSEMRVSNWIPVTVLATALGLAVGFWTEVVPPLEEDTVSTVSASAAAPRPQRPDPYTIYLVDDQAEAESVQEWLLYGETLVVTPENEELVVDAIEYIGGIQQAVGVEIQIVDFRG